MFGVRARVGPFAGDQPVARRAGMERAWLIGYYFSSSVGFGVPPS